MVLHAEEGGGADAGRADSDTGQSARCGVDVRRVGVAAFILQLVGG